jgi:hypothetical protein
LENRVGLSASKHLALLSCCDSTRVALRCNFSFLSLAASATFFALRDLNRRQRFDLSWKFDLAPSDEFTNFDSADVKRSWRMIDSEHLRARSQELINLAVQFRLMVPAGLSETRLPRV